VTPTEQRAVLAARCRACTAKCDDSCESVCPVCGESMGWHDMTNGGATLFVDGLGYVACEPQEKP